MCNVQSVECINSDRNRGAPVAVWLHSPNTWCIYKIRFLFQAINFYQKAVAAVNAYDLYSLSDATETRFDIDYLLYAVCTVHAFAFQFITL